MFIAASFNVLDFYCDFNLVMYRSDYFAFIVQSFKSCRVRANPISSYLDEVFLFFGPKCFRYELILLRLTAKQKSKYNVVQTFELNTYSLLIIESRKSFPLKLCSSPLCLFLVVLVLLYFITITFAK